MKDKRILYLYGGTASGKTALLRLLDGHPEVAVTPIHDKFIDTFAESSITSFPVEPTSKLLLDETRLDLQVFQSALTKSRYNRLQELHHGRPVRMAPSSEDIQGAPIGEFDFYDFEESWINSVNNEDNLRVHDILYFIFDSLFNQWYSYPYDDDACKYFAGLGAPKPGSLEYTLKHWEDSRVIFMRRDPRGCIASKAKKDPDKSANDLLREGRLYNVKSLNKLAQHLSKQYPNRCKILDFEYLICQHEDAMDDIREFLDILDNVTLYEATYCGEPMDDYNREYIGSINDHWTEFLSEDEVRLANLQLGKLSPGDFHLDTMQRFCRIKTKLAIRSSLERVRDRVAGSSLYR